MDNKTKFDIIIHTDIIDKKYSFVIKNRKQNKNRITLYKKRIKLYIFSCLNYQLLLFYHYMNNKNNKKTKNRIYHYSII